MGNSWAKYLNTVESGGGRNPLLLAASGGHTSTVELLITRGSSILSVDSEGNTALHLASQIGDYDTLAVMEKLRGDDFNTARLGRAPPLHVAVERGITDVVELLLQHGASANMERLPLQTPVHVAMQHGKPEVLYLLLRHGGDPNAVDWEGRASLHIAIHRQDTKYFEMTMKLLLQRGADVDAQDSNGFTPLMMYICCHLAHPLLQYRSPPTHLETLISKTRSPRTVNIFGRTALHYAASCDVPPTAVEGLLAAGAHPLTRDKLGHTPLYYSLLRDGTDVEHDSEEKTTGWLACFSTLLNAIPLKERPRQLSEALLAAVK
ncbi:ankyrin repeat-containing domain protein, partial [Neurospora tetraspora]